MLRISYHCVYNENLLFAVVVLFHPSRTCSIRILDFPYSSLYQLLCVFSSPALSSLPSFMLSQSSFPSVICLAEWELERGFVFFVTVCDVPSDPSKCLKLHYIRLSILPPKPLCHSVSVVSRKRVSWGIDFPIYPLWRCKSHKYAGKFYILYAHKITQTQDAYILHTFMHTGSVCVQYDSYIYCCSWNAGAFFSAL